MNYRKIAWNKHVQLVFFCFASLLLFFPGVNRTFASDDFLVMKRVGLDKVIFIKGFFRPLSDITLYFNYLLGGFDPAGYYLLNIFMHGVSSFLLFRFCLRWKWADDEKDQRKYAALAALLFLCYPFHNESIVWVLGRASLVAGLCGITALFCVVSDLPPGKKIFLTCLCYFIGMSGYESVILLPFLVMVVLYGRDTLRKDYLYWGAALGLTMAIHMLIRVLISGGVMGAYGKGFWSRRLLQYAGNIFKLTGRMFIPPLENSRLFLWLSVALGAILCASIFLFWQGSRDRMKRKEYFIKLLILLTVACAVPILSGISTKTSESDRFLYFPSFFLCCGVAFLLVNLVSGRRSMYGWALGLLTYQVFFLEINNHNWIRASGITGEVLKTIEIQDPGKRIFVMNLPDEWEGAFIFRLGLPDALLMKGMDTSRVVIVSHLTRETWLSLPDSIRPAGAAGDVWMGPDARISHRGTDSFLVSGTGDPEVMNGSGSGMTQYWPAGKNDVFLYWNTKRVLTWTPSDKGLNDGIK